MQIETTPFRNLLVCRPAVLSDDRGSFYESYRADLLEPFTGTVDFVQDNESISKAGVLRGLHFQVPPVAQDKLVRVVNGSVLDVVVDLRKAEPTYGQHFSLVLSSQNHLQLFIPKGFAHGFYVMEDKTIFSYKCSAYYSRENDRSMAWNDPDLDINWGDLKPTVSTKDQAGISFRTFSSPF